MEKPLSGKVAIVTGGLRGIGKESALALTRAGANVCVFDINEEENSLVLELRRKIQELGKSFLYQEASVIDDKKIKKAVAKTIKTYGRVDILVNNAGGGTNPVPLEEIDEKDWDRVVNLNLKGAFYCTRAVIGYMRKQGSGAIVNISSQAGRSKSELSNLPYASAKAGVIGFTRQLAFEVGPVGIRVNAIAPGITLSGEKVRKRWEEHPENERRLMIEAIPLRRLGKPEEIANAVLFLASEASSYITGVVLDVNGGRFML